MSKKVAEAKKSKNTDWPIVVYIWAFGLGVISYVVVGEGILRPQPHPYHWISALIGSIVGIGVGWIWYRFRGDIF